MQSHKQKHRSFLDYLNLIALLAASSSLAAQGGFPPGEGPRTQVPEALIASSSTAQRKHGLRGVLPGTERWIVHFKKRPFDLSAYRAEMLGDRDPEKVASIVAELERRMKAHQREFVEKVKALGGSVVYQYWLVNACCIEIAPKHLDTLRALQNIEWLQPDEIAVPQIKTATNANNHNADALQAQGFTGANVGLAIIDTGLDNNMNNTGRIHVTFSRRGNTNSSRLCVTRQIGSQPFDDVHGHGTGVASIAAGWRWRTSTADSGHAFDARIAGYSIANSTNGNSYLSTMAAAYNKVASDAAACRIVATNLSYSGSSNPLSVEQKAMDSLVLNADIVNCTAAGNRGSNVSGSHANINGLSVAAVSENTKNLASFSSRGMQGGRYFPNIAANGVSTNMARRNNENADYVASGTSMASPQVCGAVTQIRGINRRLRADETRAVMLASTFASPGTSSTIKVTGPGAGYLKNDGARDIARNPARHGRGTLSTSGQTFTRQIRVRTGQNLQFAIAWNRSNVNSTSWSNLDLRLKRGATILVNSNTPLNTEEFIRYRTTRNEVLTVEVVLVSLGSGTRSQSFGWASSLTTGNTSVPGRYTLYGRGCVGSGVRPAFHNVLPRAYRTKMGQSANTYPHARRMRYQQIFLGSEIGGSQKWTQLCLRRDERYGGPAQSQRIALYLGQSSRTPATLGRSFMANYSGPRRLVFNGTINLPNRTGGGGIRSFDVCIPFRAPYYWVRNGRNLIVEMINTSTGSRSHYEDFCYGRDATTARAYSFNPNAATAQALYRNQGLVMSLGRPAIRLAPRLWNLGVPMIGRSFRVYLFNAKPRTTAILVQGLRIARPIASAPGCWLYSTIRSVVVRTTTNSFGNAVATITTANDPALLGRKFANQWWVRDPVNRLGYVLTNGGEGTIGG
jgi:hypothetical protein